MAKLDLKQKLLVAIYTEYQKDLPEMAENITASNFKIGSDEFHMALLKLTNERLINGVTFTTGGHGNKILGAFTSGMLMTREGIDYVEGKLGIGPTLSAGEKVLEVTKKVGEWGYNEIKDFGVKVAAELVKGVTGLE